MKSGDDRGSHNGARIDAAVSMIDALVYLRCVARSARLFEAVGVLNSVSHVLQKVIKEGGRSTNRINNSLAGDTSSRKVSRKKSVRKTNIKSMGNERK